MMLSVCRMLLITGLVVTAVACTDERSSEHHAGSSCSYSAGRDPFPFLIDWTNEPTYLGVYYARSLCLFAELGLEVEIDQAQGANQAINAVATNRYRMATASGGATVLARNGGAEVVSLGVIYPHISTVVYGLAKTGVKNPDDLAGKRIGIYPGSITKNEFDAFVRVNNIDSGSFEVVSLSGSDISLLLSGVVDAALNYAEMSPMILASETSVEPVDGERIFQLPLSEYGVGGYGLNVVTSRATYSNDSKLLTSVAQAVFEGYRRGCANPRAATEAFLKEFPEKNADYVRASWARVCELVGDDLGKQDAEGWKQTIEVYRSLGLLGAELNSQELLP